jgi:hypothetical protein
MASQFPGRIFQEANLRDVLVGARDLRGRLLVIDFDSNFRKA